MTDEVEKISGEKSVTGNVSITVSEETVDKLADALLDAFSPFTVGMGIIGDHLRFHRENVAIKAGERSRSLAGESEFIKPVPPKLFVPWLEQVSLEDFEDDTMIDSWAALLASASKEFRSEMPLFVSILSQMTSVLANLLEAVARSEFDSSEDIRHSQSLVEGLANDDLEIFFENWVNTVISNDFKIALVEVLEGPFGRHGARIFSANHLDGESREILNTHDFGADIVGRDIYALKSSLIALQVLGLIQFKEFFQKHEGVDEMFHMMIATLTEFGMEFYSCCYPKRYQRGQHS